MTARPNPLDKRTRAEIVAHVEAGLCDREIGKLYGANDRQVWSYRRRQHIAARPKHLQYVTSSANKKAAAAHIASMAAIATHRGMDAKLFAGFTFPDATIRTRPVPHPRNVTAAVCGDPGTAVQGAQSYTGSTMALCAR